jgi:hypothetical protein
MALLHVVPSEEAEGIVKEMYSLFPEGNAPLPVRMLSASPGLLKVYAATFDYYRDHPSLRMLVLTAIRYIAAVRSGHDACVEFNRELLLYLGLRPHQINLDNGFPETLLEASEFDGRERALLQLVVQMMDDPASLHKEQVLEVKALGWKDGDLIDAANHAALIVSSNVLVKAFMKE